MGGRVAEEVGVLPIDAFIFDDARRGRPTGAWLQRATLKSNGDSLLSEKCMTL